MNGVLGHDSALLRLYWAGDNLGETSTSLEVMVNSYSLDEKLRSG